MFQSDTSHDATPSRGRQTPSRNGSQTSSLAEKKHWITPSPNRSVFRIRSASPTMRYGIRSASPSLRLSGTQSSESIESTSFDSPSQNRTKQTPTTDTDDQLLQQSPSVLRRVRSFNEEDTQPWKQSSDIEGNIIPDYDSVDLGSHSECSFPSVSFPSDASSIKSGSQIQDLKFDAKSRNKRDKNKCSSFHYDSGPYQPSRGLDKHRCSTKSVASESSSVFTLTSSVKVAAQALRDYDVFSSQAKQKSPTRSSASDNSSSSGSLFGQMIPVSADPPSPPSSGVGSNSTSSVEIVVSSATEAIIQNAGRSIELPSLDEPLNAPFPVAAKLDLPDRDSGLYCSSRNVADANPPKESLINATPPPESGTNAISPAPVQRKSRLQLPPRADRSHVTRRDANVDGQRANPTNVYSTGAPPIMSPGPPQNLDHLRIPMPVASSSASLETAPPSPSCSFSIDNKAYGSLLLPKMDADVDPSLSDGSGSVGFPDGSNTSGIDEVKQQEEAPKEERAPEEKRKVHFSEEWIKTEDDYDSEKYRKASLSSLAYPVNEDGRQGRALQAPPSPDNSKSSLSFTYSLEATDGSSSGGIRCPSDVKDVRVPKRVLPTARRNLLPKIDEKIIPPVFDASPNRPEDSDSGTNSPEKSRLLTLTTISQDASVESALPKAQLQAVDQRCDPSSSSSAKGSSAPSVLAPSPRDIILQRRKRLAAPESNPVLRQEDSSQESRFKIIPATITVDHLAAAPGSSNRGDPAVVDDSGTSPETETSTIRSSEEQKTQISKEHSQILELDGMSLIERDKIALAMDDDLSSVERFDDYGYPLRAETDFRREESSKCTSYFSRNTEDMSYLLPKRLPRSGGNGSLCCNRNKIVVTIVVAALLAVAASATVVALMFLQKPQQGLPTDSNSGVSEVFETNNPDSQKPGTNKGGVDIVLMSPDEEKPSSGSVIEDMMNGNTDGARPSQWAQLGLDIAVSSLATNDAYNFTFALSGNGQRLALGVPNDEANGKDAGAMFIFDYMQTYENWEMLGFLVGKDPGTFFGTDVALNEDGTVVAVTSVSQADSNVENPVQIFAIELANRERPNFLRRSLSSRQHEPLYDHKQYPNIVHKVRFISKALGHPKVDDLAKIQPGISLSSDGNRVSFIATRSRKGTTTAIPIVFEFDDIKDRWQEMTVETTADFAASDELTSSCLSGDGSTVAYGRTRTSDSAGLERSVILLHWNETTETWSTGFSATVEDIVSEIPAPLQDPLDSYIFGYTLSLSANGTILAIGAPSETGSGFAAVVQVRNAAESDGQWVQMSKLITETSKAFASSIDLSSDGTTLLAGSSDQLSVDYENSWIYELNESEQTWTQSTGDEFGLDGVFSSSGARVAFRYLEGDNGDAPFIRVFEIES